MSGWIKSYRSQLDHPMLQRADAHGVWEKLKLMAAYAPTDVKFRGVDVHLERGQLVVNLSDFADKCGLSRKILRLIGAKLRAKLMIEMGQAKGHAGTIITICNYDRYQSQTEPEGQAKGQARPVFGPSSGPTEQERENLESLTGLESTHEGGSLCASPAKPARKKRLHPEPPGFAVFWQSYPRKVGKLAAEKSFASAVKSGVVVAEIVAGVERYIASKPAHQDYCHPATWLTQGRWADAENVGQGQGTVYRGKPDGWVQDTSDFLKEYVDERDDPFEPGARHSLPRPH